jgi:hypothetical protein
VNNTSAVTFNCTGTVENGPVILGQVADEAITTTKINAVNINDATGTAFYLDGKKSTLGSHEYATGLDLGWKHNNTNHLWNTIQNGSDGQSYLFSSQTPIAYLNRANSVIQGTSGFDDLMLKSPSYGWKFLGMKPSRPTGGETGDFYLNSNPSAADTLGWEKNDYRMGSYIVSWFYCHHRYSRKVFLV